VVMLEDNLTAESYRAMKDIAFSVLGDRVEYMRNPCPGCYPGNDTDSLGDAVEYHTAGGLPRLSPQDAVSLDGSGLLFEGERNPRALSAQVVANLISESLAQRLSYFSLWRAERQGIYNNVPSSHPDQRVYEVPTREQQLVEIDLLRFGLLLDESDSSEEGEEER